jgi:hypothetical protein
MAIMPCLQKQDPNKDTAEYNTNEFSAILPEMQTRNNGERKRIEYKDYQRARR